MQNSLHLLFLVFFFFQNVRKHSHLQFKDIAKDEEVFGSYADACLLYFAKHAQSIEVYLHCLG